MKMHAQTARTIFALSMFILMKLAAAAEAVPAQPADAVTLHVGERLTSFSLLEPGTHRYVRYTVKGGARNAIDIWSRTVSFEPKDGAMRLHIAQRWDELEPRAVLTQDSWFEPETFRPLTHARRVEKEGAIHLGGYLFTPERVVGLATLANNERRDFVMQLTEPVYNFEYDMELLQVLPLASGRDFSIPFYDAGVDKPGRYHFKVEREDRIAGLDGTSVDCWVVSADYNLGRIWSRFWLAKRSQVLIREETTNDDGSVQVKALLPAESADPVPAAKQG